MLSPADLLDLAEQFAARIPTDPVYQEERNISWQLIGKGYLRAGNPDGALRALRQLNDLGLEAELRCAFAQWVEEHPQSEVGRAVLRETATDSVRLDPRLYPSDYAELVPIVRDLLGEAEARKLVAQIPEFPEWMNEKPEDFLNRTLAALEPWEEPPSTDTPGEKLSRYLRYHYNDLKVCWLTDQAAAGGLMEPDVASQLENQAFQRIEQARQPGVHSDIAGFSDEEFTAFLFDRPLPLEQRDEQVLKGRSYIWVEDDPAFVVEKATRLFRDFAPRVAPYTAAQVEQGLWILLGGALNLGSIVSKSEVPVEQRTACLEAMDIPFRDYLRKKPRYRGSAFFMWWDFVLIMGSDLPKVALRVLEKIMRLPGWPCQAAALHGLNHLRPDAEASALVARYIEEHRTRLKPEDLQWVERCRDGKAL